MNKLICKDVFYKLPSFPCMRPVPAITNYNNFTRGKMTPIKLPQLLHLSKAAMLFTAEYATQTLPLATKERTLLLYRILT